MKRIVLITLAMASLMAYAQYQLPNPGFEQWDGGNTSEPTHWNSFATSDGDYATLPHRPTTTAASADVPARREATM